jgi:hypothetical protein
VSLSYSAPDYSRAEKSYRAASIQRDHLTAGVILALDNIDDVRRRLGDALPWEVNELLKRAHHDLKFAVDAAEGVR